MNDIKNILEQYKNNEISLDDALLALKKEPFEDIGYAKVDLHRKIRQGAAEVIYGEGKTPEQILELILGDLNLEIMERVDTQFYCNCSKDRVAKALISIGKEELEKMIEEGNEVELNCHFCNTNYIFSVEELKELYTKSK